MSEGLGRVFRLAARHYAASPAVWLATTPIMFIGLLFTEAIHSWQAEKVLGFAVAGIFSHLALGLVLWLARRTILAPIRAQRAGWREVLLTYASGGLVRAITIGLTLEFLAISPANFLVLIITSIVLVTFSFTLFAYSAELWWQYRSQRKTLLMSIAVGESPSNRSGGAATESHPILPTAILHDVDNIRAQTAQALENIRARVRSGGIDSESVSNLLLGSDQGWREVSHKAWALGSPKLPAMGSRELARTMASSQPFSWIALSLGPVYGFFRIFDVLPVGVAFITAFIWWSLALAIATATNQLAKAAGERGFFVLLIGYVALLLLVIALGAALFDDAATQSRLVFVALVTTTASLAVGFPPALERSSEKVMAQLEKRLGVVAITTLQSQGAMFVTAQRIAGYLHSEVRGHFLRESLALGETLKRGDRNDIEAVLDRLDLLVSTISLDAAECPGLGRLISFLDNWATIIDLSHNVASLPEVTRLDTGLEALVMEAVNDAVRHGAATTVTVNLEVTPQRTRVDVMSNSGESAPSRQLGLGSQALEQLAPGTWSRSVTPEGLFHLAVVVVTAGRH